MEKEEVALDREFLAVRDENTNSSLPPIAKYHQTNGGLSSQRTVTQSKAAPSLKDIKKHHELKNIDKYSSAQMSKLALEEQDDTEERRGADGVEAAAADVAYLGKLNE